MSGGESPASFEFVASFRMLLLGFELSYRYFSVRVAGFWSGSGSGSLTFGSPWEGFEKVLVSGSLISVSLASSRDLFVGLSACSLPLSVSSRGRFFEEDLLLLLLLLLLFGDCGLANAWLCFWKLAARPLTVFGVKKDVRDCCFFSEGMGEGAILEDKSVDGRDEEIEYQI